VEKISEHYIRRGLRARENRIRLVPYDYGVLATAVKAIITQKNSKINKFWSKKYFQPIFF